MNEENEDLWLRPVSNLGEQNMSSTTKTELDLPSVATFNGQVFLGLTIFGFLLWGFTTPSRWPQSRVFAAVGKQYLGLIYVLPYLLSAMIIVISRNTYAGPSDAMNFIGPISLGLYIVGWIHGNIVLSQIKQSQ